MSTPSTKDLLNVLGSIKIVYMSDSGGYARAFFENNVHYADENVGARRNNPPLSSMHTPEEAVSDLFKRVAEHLESDGTIEVRGETTADESRYYQYKDGAVREVKIGFVPK